MNRPTAALPWWLLTTEGTYEGGVVLPSSATGLGFPARVLLDQLLQPMACELRYQLIGGERACPPGVPTNLAPTALNSRGALPPAMPAGVAVPRGLDHYGERQRAVVLARDRNAAHRT
jgi:hypothetical protein